VTTACGQGCADRALAGAATASTPVPISTAIALAAPKIRRILSFMVRIPP
jgi:hypothetical protein